MMIPMVIMKVRSFVLGMNGSVGLSPAGLGCMRDMVEVILVLATRDMAVAAAAAVAASAAAWALIRGSRR